MAAAAATHFLAKPPAPSSPPSPGSLSERFAIESDTTVYIVFCKRPHGFATWITTEGRAPTLSRLRKANYLMPSRGLYVMAGHLYYVWRDPAGAADELVAGDSVQLVGTVNFNFARLSTAAEHFAQTRAIANLEDTRVQWRFENKVTYPTMVFNFSGHLNFFAPSFGERTTRNCLGPLLGACRDDLSVAYPVTGVHMVALGKAAQAGDDEPVAYHQKRHGIGLAGMDAAGPGPIYYDGLGAPSRYHGGVGEELVGDGAAIARGPDFDPELEDFDSDFDEDDLDEEVDDDHNWEADEEEDFGFAEGAGVAAHEEGPGNQ
jgi:hypothetical protein